MTAVIVPFPIVRRRAFIAKQADHATCLNPDAAERYLEYQLQVQRDAMRRRGVAEDLIARELKCMERAVRQELLRASLSTGAT
jgi:Family of unknown function (DUF6074)